MDLVVEGDQGPQVTRLRGRGEGGIYQRADGQWCASVSLGYYENGKRKRRVIYGATKKEVQGELRKVQDTVQNEIRTVLDDTPPVHHPMEIPPAARVEAEPDDHGDSGHTDIEDLSGGTFS